METTALKMGLACGQPHLSIYGQYQPKEEERKLKSKKTKKEREKRRIKNTLTLEAKVRAVKLIKVDSWEAEKVLENIEQIFGVKFSQHTWDNPDAYLEDVETEIMDLYFKLGPHRPRLVKLLLQAQLIETDTLIKKPHNEEDGDNQDDQ